MISKIPFPYIFIHIPKTGGTSIELALIKISTGRTDFRYLTRNERISMALPAPRSALQHNKLKWFERRVSLPDYHVFSVVRNPYDRALSQIWYLRTRFPEGATLFKYRRWTDNLRVLAETKSVIAGHDLGSTQCEYLQKLDGSVGVNTCLHFETLNKDWQMWLNKLGLSRDQYQLPKEFDSGRLQPYQEFYDTASIELITNKYKKDIDLFSYRFE